MGCDIHLHIEVEIDGKWCHMNEPDVDRHYRLFARMAGVRNDATYEAEPISQPRGLPDDISTVTNMHAQLWEGDAHSHSWLSMGELALIEQEFEQPFGCVFGCRFRTVHDCPAEFPPHRIRAVFWFDN